MYFDSIYTSQRLDKVDYGRFEISSFSYFKDLVFLPAFLICVKSSHLGQ